MNILKNKPVMRMYKYSVIAFNYLNKYLYILSILSLLSTLNSTLKQSKLYKIISWLIKITLLVNILIGTGFVIYFTDFVSPFDQTFSFYFDILKPYIDFIKNFWNDLININIEDSIISNVKDSNNIKNQVKEGIKEGVKEALGEILEEIEDEIKSQSRTALYKNIALCGSVILFGYIFLILPGSSINPTELVEYNWINQSIIELKVNVKDFVVSIFNKPVNPSAPGNTTVVNAPINPTDVITSPQISPTNSVISEGFSTITPNTPIARVSNISMTEVGLQTEIDGLSVSKMVETVNMLEEVLGKYETTMIQDGVDSVIKNITD